MSALTDRIDPYTMDDHDPTLRVQRGFRLVLVRLTDNAGDEVAFVLTEGRALELSNQLLPAASRTP